METGVERVVLVVDLLDGVDDGLFHQGVVHLTQVLLQPEGNTTWVCVAQADFDSRVQEQPFQTQVSWESELI